MSIKTHKVIHEKNSKLSPKDLIIFNEAFSDIYFLLKTPINYISQDSYTIGQTAFRIILEHCKSETYLTQHITIDCKLELK